MRRNAILVFFSSLAILILANIPAFGQNPSADSVRLRILDERAAILDDSSLIRISQEMELAKELNNLYYQASAILNQGKFYKAIGENDSAFYFLRQSQAIFQNIGETKRNNTSLLEMGLLHMRLGAFDSSKSYFDQAKELSQKAKDELGMAMAIHNTGIMFRKQSKITEAIAEFEKALSLYEKIGEIDKMPYLYQSMGALYYSQSEEETAIEYFNKSAEYFEKSNNQAGLAAAYINLGAVILGDNETLRDTAVLNQALANFQKGKKLYEALENPSGIATGSFQLAAVYSRMEQYPEAINNAQEAISILEPMGPSERLTQVYYLLGNAQTLSGNIQPGLKNCKKALAMSEESGILYQQMNCTGCLSFANEKLGNYKLALQYKNKHMALMDSNENREYYQELARMEQRIAFEQERYADSLDKKKMELDHQSEVVIHQRNTYLAIGLAAVLLLISGFIFLTAKRRKEQNRVLRDKNQLIQNQKDKAVKTGNQLERALSKNKMLLREIHHRVKNNLQVISSLLGLQLDQLESEIAKEALAEGRNRVQSISLVHNKLYRQDDLQSIPVREYIPDLLNAIQGTFGKDKKVEVQLDLEDIHLEIDRAVPFGLIISELMTNAFKYAFQPEKENKMNIKMEETSSDHYCLEISDNGPGLSPNFNIENQESLGMRLISGFTMQMEGAISYSFQNGAMFKLTFKRSFESEE